MSFSFVYLFDEHVPRALGNYLSARHPELRVFRIGQAPAPALGTLDPDLLIWCEVNNAVLLTNNRKSMPLHLRDHLNAGRHVPGIFDLPRWYKIEDVGERLALIAGASFEGEYADQILQLPLG
jgi:hypothetical protein